MSQLQYLPNEYQTMVKFSGYKHILVEGSKDKRAFSSFIDQLTIKDIVIDSAEILKSPGESIYGNREKVEYTCSVSIPNLVGFVDREFREFELSKQIVDKLNEHKVVGQIVWSRGHSIENYCFNLDIVRDTLRIFSLSEYSNQAIQMFNALYNKLILIMSAASLAGFESGLLSVLPSTINYNMYIVEHAPIEVTINNEIWKDNLIKRDVPSEKVEQFIARYSAWCEEVAKVELDTLRWLSHGHIGIAIIWSAYTSFVYSVARNAGADEKHAKKEAQRVVKAEVAVRLNAMLELWVKASLERKVEFPFQIFQLLEYNL